MIRRIPLPLLLIALLLLLHLDPAGATDNSETLKQKPITTASGKVGELLRQWWKEDTAAGNVGDWYDNRDGGHSPLNLSLYPQLQAIKYSPDDVKLGKHWAAQRVLVPGVVFGNSSTSAPPTLGGSNPRLYYTQTRGLQFLYAQYRHNNVYIYPEHRDHDPGHNGPSEGFGDLYPTNTPYLFISQGSSGSDQPFMRAIPLTLAAFRPEVKKKLTETGLLMPTLQMILRRTNKHLKDPAEYLTGRAHPTVFEGSWVDDLAVIQMAHAMDLKALPPLVQLKVLEEEQPRPNVDYFEPAGLTEVLADTQCVIARVFRGKERTRRLVVSAAESIDVNHKPLTYTWVVLRGDAQQITIRPRNKENSVVEIVVPWPQRRPVTPGSPLESNRIDIGVFAHNGTYHSAPGFITFTSLDNEARAYDDQGKILEIAYGMGETTVSVPNWEKVLPLLASPPSGVPGLEIDAERRKFFASATAQYRELFEVQRQARIVFEKIEAVERAAARAVQVAGAQVKEAEKALAQEATKENGTRLEQAKQVLMQASGERDKARLVTEEVRKPLNKAQQAVQDFLRKRQEPLANNLTGYVEQLCRKVSSDAGHRAWQWQQIKERGALPAARQRRLEAQLKTLERWGILTDKDELNPLRPGPTPPWTAFEQAQFEAFHTAVLAELVFDGQVNVSYQTNYVDFRLTVPREWRDVYHHDAKGRLLGWTRHGADGKTEYNHEGLLIVAKDAHGRCTRARPVRYVVEPVKGRERFARVLRPVAEESVIAYEFAGDDDPHGRQVGSRPAAPEKK
jgi:hypothetical protein